MQSMWCDAYDWDEKLSDELKMKVEHWMKDLPSLDNVKVRRSLNIMKETEQTTYIHMFVDASEKAMCAVAYIRNEAKDRSIDVRFVSTKCKVAPLIATSIPRLELSAAVTGLRLALTITKVRHETGRILDR